MIELRSRHSSNLLKSGRMMVSVSLLAMVDKEMEYEVMLTVCV